MNARLALVSLSVMIALGGCGGSPESHVKMAQNHINKSDYSSAVIELKTVLQSQPDRADARLLLGQTLFKLGEYPAAEKELTKARALGIGDDIVLPYLAKALLELGQYQKLLDEVKPRIGLTSSSMVDIYAAHASAWLALGKLDAAARAIADGEAIQAGRPELELAKARLLQVQGKSAAALQLLDTILRSTPKFVAASIFKAELLWQQNQRQAAMATYEEVVRIDPKQASAHVALAALQLAAGNVEAAGRAIQAAEKVAPANLAAQYMKALLYFKQGKLKDSRDSLQQILRVAPEFPAALLLSASVNYGLGAYQNAITDAQKVLAQTPENRYAAKLLVASNIKSGNLIKALEILYPMLKDADQDPSLLALAGEAYLRKHDYAKAMVYLEKAAASAPGSTLVKARLATTRLASGDSARALNDLESLTMQTRQPDQADMVLIQAYLNRREFDLALKAITNFEKKLPKNPITHHLRGLASIGQHDLAAARRAFDQALSIRPDFYPAVINLARLDILDQRQDQAKKRIEDLLGKDANNVPAMLAMADLAGKARDAQGYISWLERAINARPNELESYVRLAHYYLQNKNAAKAMTVARSAVSANPNLPQALSLLGSTQLSSGDVTAALATFAKFVNQSPNSPVPYYMLASTQLQAKQTEDAKKNLRQALQVTADFLPAWELLLRIELAAKRLDQAILIARQMQANFPSLPVGYEQEGELQLLQGQPVKAAQLFEKAFGREKSGVRAIKLHQTWAAAGKPQQGMATLQQWHKEHPNDLYTVGYLAQWHLNMQEYKPAALLYERMLKAVPNNLLAMNNLAWAYHKTQDARALATAERAYQLKPDAAFIADTLGWILTEQGKTARAVEVLAQANKLAPGNPGIAFHYAKALSLTSEKNKARQILNQALSSKLVFPERKEAEALRSQL